MDPELLRGSRPWLRGLAAKSQKPGAPPTRSTPEAVLELGRNLYKPHSHLTETP